MNSVVRKIIIFFGFSLVIGVSSGIYFESKEYQISGLNTYNNHIPVLINVKTLKQAYDIKDYGIHGSAVTPISRFNTEKAIVVGTLTFGLLLIGLSFVKSKT